MSIRSSPRDLGLWLGQMPVGTFNDITDVPGVRVGHVSLVKGAGPLLPSGKGPVRTGVTAVIPRGENLYRHPCWAGIEVINGYGKSLGVPFIQEMGYLNCPIMLTNTLSVNDVAHGVLTYLLQQNPEIGNDARSPNVVVMECDDSYLNDIRGRHVRPWDGLIALQRAGGGPIAQGNVGAGVGMSCFQLKGGIGSSSRIVQNKRHRYTLGMLALANFGQLRDLIISGVPIGELLTIQAKGYIPGSLILIGITDAPISRWQLRQLARRASLGMARTGSISMTGSGDFCLMVSTAPFDNRNYLSDWDLDDFFRSVTEATAESIWNALFLAETMEGRDGNIRRALPIEKTLELIKSWKGGY
ncbi:L-aminopeptidase/D-esterase [Desulfosporosinus acidiphilus SJ4]|uniref:L-aminopeptidase/D-esterase n=1 Tax=Desulfosporosinus acidiphilus (strain DSM 22704 / JCM 16185 / SJ4) TaxID=646529 RepID=I4D8H4_DESAJ|nr:P1 family peptidase [Desulfosporosinus acidiphilus]AFM42098.1 L-aminopeptidase/D-esterase [Desulfosporosinus acidiphilus SJ4]